MKVYWRLVPDLQKQMSQFSHQMLDEVQSKDVGPIGDTLSRFNVKTKVS